MPRLLLTLSDHVSEHFSLGESAAVNTSGTVYPGLNWTAAGSQTHTRQAATTAHRH